MIMNGQLNQRPDLVIFDMDGLILDSERLFMEQERIVCLQYGYDMTPENYITTIGTAGETLRKILRDLYGDDYPMEKISRESHRDLQSNRESASSWKHCIEIRYRSASVRQRIRTLQLTIWRWRAFCRIFSSSKAASR